MRAVDAFERIFSTAGLSAYIGWPYAQRRPRLACRPEWACGAWLWRAAPRDDEVRSITHRKPN